MQLIVTVNKLNKRSAVPSNLSDNNIIGVVLKGFRFEGTEISDVPNPSLGKWYVDRDNSYYWGGGLIIEKTPVRHSFNVPGLPINLPAGCSLGIDLSHHNDNPDWAAIVSAGATFAYIKITEGVGTPDTMAREHAINAIKNGLQIGYYHFCHPDTRNGGTVVSDATAEANEALSRIAPLSVPGLPLALDLEDETGWDSPLDKNDYLLWVKTFVARVQEKGVTPVIYSRKEYLDGKLPPDHDLGNLQLWLASYSEKNCNTVACPKGWANWALWQFTESAVVGGNTQLDLNIKKA